MLLKKYRFQGPGATRRVQKHGRNTRYGSLSVRTADAQLDHSRVAIVVSKKVDKRAVVRNRIRRRLYELFRAHWPELKHPTDITIGVFSAELATMSHEVLEKEFLALLDKAGLLQQPSS